MAVVGSCLLQKGKFSKTHEIIGTIHNIHKTGIQTDFLIERLGEGSLKQANKLIINSIVIIDTVTQFNNRVKFMISDLLAAS